MNVIWKRMIAYFLITALLVCGGNAQAVSAQTNINVTAKDLSGVKRKLTMDAVKKPATEMDWYSYVAEYGQVADGHYYYMRQTGKNNRCTIYRDAGIKIGSFQYTFPGPEYMHHAFVWHEGKLYIEFIHEEDGRTIKLGMVDLKKEIIKIISTCTLPAGFDMSSVIEPVYLYQHKIYFIHDMTVTEFDMSSGNLLHTYSLPKAGSSQSTWVSFIADEKIYYTIKQRKGKKQIFTLRCQDMATGKEQKIFRCKDSDPGGYFMMKGKEIYYCKSSYKDRSTLFNFYQCELAYSIPYAGGKMRQVGQGEIYDFACNHKYYFYIDKKFRLHRQNRKTGKDKIISGIKAVKVDCNGKGLYVQKYDKWFNEGGYECTGGDYAPALYFMDFKGRNVKKIARYNKGGFNE